MAAVSSAILSLDIEGTRLWHDRRIEATISLRYDKTDPAIGDQAAEANVTDASCAIVKGIVGIWPPAVSHPSRRARRPL